MPTYTYRCDSCGHQFDISQRFSEDPLTECPVCGATIRRVIQPVGVVFKGSGWYITDSRAAPREGGESKPAAAESEKSEKADKADKSGKESAREDAPAKETAAKDAAAKPAAPPAERPAAKAAD